MNAKMVTVCGVGVCLSLMTACSPMPEKAAQAGRSQASCEGIFCSCTGPAGSEDCNKISGCIDDLLCVGDSCGCIGGTAESEGPAINDLTARDNREEASCDGIFCSCRGPADSEDCNTITGCIDDITCIGDSCGCIGGSAD